MEMSYTSLGGNSHVTVGKDLTIRHSPLVTSVLLHNGNPQIQLVAQVIFWAAPITISAGCRLILSIREAAYSQYLTSVSHRTTSTLAEASHCVRGHIKGDCEACGHDTGLARYDLRGAS